MADKKRTGISYDMLRLQLMERLKDNFADYMDDIRTLSVDDIAVWSHETASKAKAYHYLADATDLKRADIEYLLQFRDPLSIVADEFAWNIGIKSEAASLQDVFKKQSALQQGYELMPEQENMRTAGVVTVCVNGELRKGDLVLTTPENDYACLVGTVLAIEKAGTPDHHTDNEGDDIHVNFMEAEYSENRMLEIQDMLWDLDGRPTPPKPDVLPPLDVDDVIMAPDMLIRINGIGREELEEILDSGKNAAAYYERTVAAHVSGLSDKDKPLFDGSASYNQIRQFSDRVDQHYKDFENAMLGKSKEEIFGAAEKIAAMDNARYYLTEYAHEFSPEDIEGLMKLDDPLSVVAFGWRKYTEDLSDMTKIIGVTAISADIAKGGLDPDNADKRVMRSFIPDDDKPSVLDMIRQAREESKRNPVPRKDAPAKGREPEL